jgi:hypothetical protein
MKIQELLRDHAIAIQQVDRSKIRSNAVIFRVPDGGHIIFLDRGLPDNLKLFSLAHEAAHLDLGLLYTKTSQYDMGIERRVDRRAIDLLEDALAPGMYAVLLEKFDASEGALFGCLAKDAVFRPEALAWLKGSLG